MKIMVIKKATANAKPQGYCPAFVDDDGVTGSTKKS
jgi:hypothetical protein